MFENSIDLKPEITDNNGNVIINLAQSMFAREKYNITSYDVKKLNSFFVMRPDLVADAEYKSPEHTEYILKYTGISNPFSLAEDDVVMIPNEDAVSGVLAANNPDSDTNADTYKNNEAAIRNYFKFVNQDYKSDSTSYDNLANLSIPSGIQDPNEGVAANYIVPYISENDSQAVTIRNGRMYFGEDSGLSSAAMIAASATSNIDMQIQALVDSTVTALSDTNCIYNGVKLADFVRASVNSRKNE